MRQKKYEDTYKDAYAYVSDYLKDKVVRKMEVVKFSALVSIFKSKVEEIGVTVRSPHYDPQCLKVSFVLSFKTNKFKYVSYNELGQKLVLDVRIEHKSRKSSL